MADAMRITKGVDAIVHLGGYSVEGPWEGILSANIVGCYNAYEAARRNGVKRFLFATSNHAVGFYRRDEIIDHKVYTKPDSRYGVSKVFGEAMDSGDKATNKAMSAAYKYAAFQAFCIPTEGDNDADKTTHEVSPFVTWAQANQIEALAEEHGVDLAAILKYAKAKTTAEIPANLFATIVANLEKKAKKEA